MAARLWTALLLLAGVFVMHGAQCMTAADDAGHPSSAAQSTVLAPTASLMHDAAAAATVVPGAGIVPVGAALAGPPSAAHQAVGAPATATPADRPSSDSHGTAGHLWTVCLAVLAAALAVLLAVLLPHLRLVARLALPRMRAWLRSLSPPRPPDLSELCLLRI